MDSIETDYDLCTHYAENSMSNSEIFARPVVALNLSLQFADASHRELLTRYRVRKWLTQALNPQQVRQASFCVRIVGENEGRSLNRAYRGKDYATNVLTFDYEQGPQLQADLVLCAPVVAREAHEQHKALIAHYAHLLVHGALHAQGYDHENTQEAQIMEQLEVDVLLRMGFPNPY